MTRLFHGGISGLKEGDLLLPPDRTGHHVRGGIPGARAVNGQSWDQWIGPQVNRSDRVYLTTDREFALGFAGAWGLRNRTFGALYVAEPEGGTEPDPDNPELCVQCPEARITRVYDPVVILSGPQVSRRLTRHVDTDGMWIVRGGRVRKLL